MSTKKEQFEVMEREARMQNNDKVDESMFAELLNKVKEYATKRKREAAFKKSRGDPMDIGEVNEYQWDSYD